MTETFDYAAYALATDLASKLDELHAALTRYVVFPSREAAHAVTLWIAATHAQQSWEHAPRLVAVSPEKRCGKSRLMDVVEATCHGPIVTVNASTAAVVRSIDDDDPPTLLVDEADTIFGTSRAAESHEDLRGVLNAGHQRNRPYVRWDITTRSRESCPTFAMAMLASIGDLPDTIMDRAVVVRMRRRGPGEKVQPYRTRRDGEKLSPLREALVGCLGVDERKVLQDTEPSMPVDDRAADTWEPLVAVADLAGGDWPKRARDAVTKLVAAEHEADMDASLGVRLLTDIRTLLDETKGSFVASTMLVGQLRTMDDAPWSDLELTTRGLADRLRPYGIKPRPNGSLRGYDRAMFSDAFTRYVPPVKNRQPVGEAS